MTKAILKKGNITYEFVQYKDEPEVCYILGEEANWKGVRGLTRCILSASGNAEWGNKEYIKFRKQGFIRVE